MVGEEKNGLVLVFTGNGKGKTTAALGMGLRAWGQGMKVLMLQFIKSNTTCGELLASNFLDGLEIRPRGEGFIKNTDESVLEPLRPGVRKALEEARGEIVSGRWDMVILDEIIYALGFKLLKEEDLVDLASFKTYGTHIVFTGRGAPPSLIERSDLVTEMKEIKHHFNQSVKAQSGIEF